MLKQFRDNPFYRYYIFALQQESNVSLQKSEEPYKEDANFGALMNRERARGEANAHLRFQQLCDEDQASLIQQIKQEDSSKK